MESVLQLKNGCKSWKTGDGSFVCLKGVSLDVYAGQSLAVVGPSGCGKSTLLHVLSLLTPLDAGSVHLAGKEVSALKHGADPAVRGAFGLVFQDGKLIPSLSVLENVCVPLIHRGCRWSRQKTLAGEILEKVGLSHRADHPTSRLSGGEQIRVAIARALVLDPAIVLADEPTGTLDLSMGAQIAALLFSVVRENRALVMVTHNETLAKQADRLVRMADGRVAVEPLTDSAAT
jgi:putative ABC transport system ATP-binding protein